MTTVLQDKAEIACLPRIAELFARVRERQAEMQAFVNQTLEDLEQRQHELASREASLHKLNEEIEQERLQLEQERESVDGIDDQTRDLLDDLLQQRDELQAALDAALATEPAREERATGEKPTLEPSQMFPESQPGSNKKMQSLMSQVKHLQNQAARRRGK